MNNLFITIPFLHLKKIENKMGRKVLCVSCFLFVHVQTLFVLGVDELKQAKIDVKMLFFLQFLLHLSMWCHFNDM
jgi:hypothetical protein